MTKLQLYANLVSQPSRAVAWLLKIHSVDYELINVEFGGAIATSEAFLKLNPNGFVPVLVDGDFALFEGNAILTYLAEKFAWDQWYPRDELLTRAKINEYLHWHHGTVRSFTTKVLRPLVRQSLGAATTEELTCVGQVDDTIAKHTAIVEKLLVKDYIARTDAPTIADLALYCEYDQLEAIGVLDLAKFPNTSAWLARMKQVPFHDEIRVSMHGFLTAVGLEQQSADATP